LDQACFFDRNQWQARRKDGSTVNLSLVFRDGLFNYSLPFHRNEDGTIAFLKEGINDGYTLLEPDSATKFPLKYSGVLKVA